MNETQYPSPAAPTPKTTYNPHATTTAEATRAGCAAVPLLSLLGMFVGATILGCAICGPVGLLAGPILMLFGWFYLPVVIGLHVCAWFAWPWCKTCGMSRYVFALLGAIIGAGLFALIGVKEQGRVFHYTAAYAIAAAFPGFISGIAIATIRQHAMTSPVHSDPPRTVPRESVIRDQPASDN